MSASSPMSGSGPVLRSFTSLLKLSVACADLATGRAVHAPLAARGLSTEALAVTALAHMYAKCRRLVDARRVFDRMPARDRVAWNAWIGLAEAAVGMVVRMQEEDGERPDAVTLVSVCREVGEWPLEEAREPAALALRCVEMRRGDRPGLCEHVLEALERMKDLAPKAAATASESSIVLLGSSTPTLSHFLCPILQFLSCNIGKLLSKMQLSRDFQDNSDVTEMDLPGHADGPPLPTSSHTLRMAALSELQNGLVS